MSELLVYIYICTVFDFYIWISALLKYLFRVCYFVYISKHNANLLNKNTHLLKF